MHHLLWFFLLLGSRETAQGNGSGSLGSGRKSADAFCDPGSAFPAGIFEKRDYTQVGV